MPAFQSSRSRKSKWAAANTPAALSRRRATNNARRQAEPAPSYDAYEPGREMLRVTLQGPGWAHVVQCLVPADTQRNRPRSDQHTVIIDGQPWADRAGLVALFDHLRDMVPRRLTRGELATRER